MYVYIYIISVFPDFSQFFLVELSFVEKTKFVENKNRVTMMEWNAKLVDVLFFLVRVLYFAKEIFREIILEN